jgi:hypothetical protein
VFVAAIAALCLVLGGVGSATASGLSKGTVKKIAAKVVTKRASSLTVSHATSADTATSATQLSGFTASQLQTSAYRYALPVQDFAGGHNYSFPGLEPGTCLASYSMAGGTTALTDVLSCFFQVGPQAFAGAQESSQSHFVTVRGTDTFTVTSTPIFLACSSGSGYKLNSSYGNIVSFVPIDLPVTKAATGS